jgi:bacterioferritin-associated ferredoxin
MNSREKFIDQLFLCTLDDIRQRQAVGRLYDCVRCGELLRQLLMDGEKSLVDLVNRPHKLKIVYEIADHGDGFKPNSQRQWINISKSDDWKTKNVNREAFIKAPICCWDGHIYNVGDLIDYYSHFLGGIHAGVPKDEKEILFIQISHSFPFIKDWPSYSFHNVVSITLKALEPLENVIKGHASTGGL